MKEIILDEKEHKYTVDGKELISCTTFLSKYFPKFDAEKKAEEMGKRDGREPQDILDDWKEIAKQGTLVHEEIEKYINDGLMPQSSKGLMGAHWCQTNQGDDELVSEMRVFSEELGIAGTIDLVIKHKPVVGCLKQRVTLSDWKTNKAIYRKCFGRGGLKEASHLADCNYNKYQLQLSLYAYILEKEYDVVVDGIVLVHLKDGGFKDYRMDVLRELIEEMVK